MRAVALVQRLPRPRTLPQWLLLGVVAAYAGAFSYWTIRNHDGYGTFSFDLGIFDQGVWLLSRFQAPFVTITGRNLFGDHTSFILLPLVPVYWVFPSAIVLLVAQSTALAFTAVPIFRLGQRRIGDEWLALILATAVLLQPALQWSNFEQFHPDVFEVPLAALALLFMLEERWTAYFVSIAALLSVKEDATLLVLGIGVYVALRKNRKIGLITCGAAIGYGLFAVYVVLRTINGVGSLNGWRIPFGGFSGAIKTLFEHPIRFWNYLASDSRPLYVWQLFAPLALLPLLAPDIALVAAGPLASNLISTFYYQHRIQYHYTTLIVPLLGVATVIAVSRLRADFARYLATGTVAFAALASAYYWGPMPGMAHPTVVADPSTPAVRDLNHAVSLIPPNASVSALFSYVPHLDHRKEIYNFPVPFKAEYWGTFTQDGQRLPQADHVDYLVLPPVMSDPDTEHVLEQIRPDYVTVWSSPYVMVLKHKTA